MKQIHTISNNIMWIALFYDKFAGSHQYNNILTKEVTVDTLEESDNYHRLFGNDSVTKFNSTFPINKSLHLPTTGKHGVTNKLYQIESYHLEVKEKVTEFYVIVKVNCDLLYQHIQNKEMIPNKEFLMKTCRCHYQYTTNTKKYLTLDRNEQVNLYMSKVIDRVMVAAEYNEEPPIDDPDEITATLFKYQKCSINWMKKKENNPISLAYNINDEILLDQVYIDLKLHTLDLVKKRDSIQLHGGAIIDEVGLGKTLQITTLGVINPPTGDDAVTISNGWYKSRATLVICPTQLCGQWKRELKNMISKKYKPSILSILSKTHFEKLTYLDLISADFVIISFTFLDNKAFTSKWLPVTGMKNVHRMASTAPETLRKLFDAKKDELMKDPVANIFNNQPILPNIHWHRLVVDEFHEVYTNSKYTYLKNILPSFKSNHRWCVTATPFCAKENLYHITNFLSNYQCKSRYIFESDDVINYVAEEVFRRNTKNSVKKEHTLPPIKEDVVWLRFTATERMMYNAYIANPNNDKFSVYLRQLCCHPKLADETKHALSNCKTLQDIEKMMVLHYEKDVVVEKSKVHKIKVRIARIDQKLRRIARRQKIAKLKKAGKLPKPLPLDLCDTDSDEEIMDMEPGIKSSTDSSEEMGLFVKVDVLDLDDDIDGDLDGNNKLMMVVKLEEAKTMANLDLFDANKLLQGKESTCNFFKNVVLRIRKTVKADTPDKEKVVNIDAETDSDTDSDTDTDTDSDTDSDDEYDEECGICMGEIPEDDVGVTKCGHMFCFQCLKSVGIRNHSCPMCRKPLKDTDIFMLNYQKKKPVEDNIIETKKGDMSMNELIDNVGTKLANLIKYLRSHDNHTIIFSQWDDLLRKVGKVLSDHGINNVFCRGNVFQRDKAIREFNENENMKVIMLSSEKAASGTNLTKATQVIFLDPIYGNYQYRKDIESQAVGRAHRLGQKKSITVVRLIIEETVESEIYKSNQKEDTQNIKPTVLATAAV